MEKITQDFQFNKFSAQYGRFLIAVNDMAPAAKISDVSSYYTTDSGTIYVSVDVSEDIAMLLKLQFGLELAKRPIVDTVDTVDTADYEEYMYNLKSLMKNYTVEEYKKNNKYINDTF
jgi:hypothetical protein